MGGLCVLNAAVKQTANQALVKSVGKQTEPGFMYNMWDEVFRIWNELFSLSSVCGVFNPG